MSSKHLCDFIAILNLAVRTKKTNVKITLKNNYIKTFVDLLLKENFIYGYQLEKTTKFFLNKPVEKVLITLKPNFIKRINILSSPSNKKSVNIHELEKLLNNNTSGRFVLTNSVLGFSTSSDCLKKGTGGLLICEIKI